MTDRELMQMALEALDSDNPHIQVGAAISLRYRLAQPEPTPVAWREVAGKTTRYYDYNECGHGEPLYLSHVHAIDISQERVDEMAKHKHEWVGLTDQDLAVCKSDEFVVFAQEIEAKLKEKNGG